MSFSSTVKNELCRMEVKNNCCLLAEIAAVIRISGMIRLTAGGDANIRIVTENAAFARRIFSMIKKLFNVYPEVVTRKSKKLKKHTLYILVVTPSIGAKHILEKVGIDLCTGHTTPANTGQSGDCAGYSENLTGILKKQCCKKAYLRGVFLAGGSISDPEKIYHLEIVVHDKALVDKTCEFINEFGLNAKVIKRKGAYVTYLKEGENIVDFLNIAGAHGALLELENIRILKEMRNNVNRIVNCETANLDKTVNASMRQVENIKYIKDCIGFDNIPENLRDVAELRLLHNDANLKELGEMLNPVLGKSGVNHRLRKLDEIAENARKSKGVYTDD